MKRQKPYIDIWLEIFMEGKNLVVPAKLYKGTPKRSCPSTYNYVSVVGHSLGNDYNPSILTLYRAKDKTLRYEIYRDGSIYPYYGKIEILKPV